MLRSVCSHSQLARRTTSKCSFTLWCEGRLQKTEEQASGCDAARHKMQNEGWMSMWGEYYKTERIKRIKENKWCVSGNEKDFFIMTSLMKCFTTGGLHENVKSMHFFLNRK